MRFARKLGRSALDIVCAVALSRWWPVDPGAEFTTWRGAWFTAAAFCVDPQVSARELDGGVCRAVALGLPLESACVDAAEPEVLWMREGMTVKRMANLFRERPGALPSDLVPEDQAREVAERVVGLLREKGVERFGVWVDRAGEYPAKLREARHPVEVRTLVEFRRAAVGGGRRYAEGERGGRRRATQLARGSHLAHIQGSR